MNPSREVSVHSVGAKWHPNGQHAAKLVMILLCLGLSMQASAQKAKPKKKKAKAKVEKKVEKEPETTKGTNTIGPIMANPPMRISDVIVEVVDEEAYFAWGFERYFKENMSREGMEEESGTVEVSIVVNGLGRLSQIKVIKGMSERVDKEVIRTLESMPAWTPGKVDGRAVTSRVVLQIKVE